MKLIFPAFLAFVLMTEQSSCITPSSWTTTRLSDSLPKEALAAAINAVSKSDPFRDSVYFITCDRTGNESNVFLERSDKRQSYMVSLTLNVTSNKWKAKRIVPSATGKALSKSKLNCTAAFANSIKSTGSDQNVPMPFKIAASVIGHKKIGIRICVPPYIAYNECYLVINSKGKLLSSSSH